MKVPEVLYSRIIAEEGDGDPELAVSKIEKAYRTDDRNNGEKSGYTDKYLAHD